MDMAHAIPITTFHSPTDHISTTFLSHPHCLSIWLTPTFLIRSHPDNTGDHLLVSASLQLPSDQDFLSKQNTIENDFVPNYIWRNEKFTNLYRQNVSDLLQHANNADLQGQLDNLHHIFKHSASAAFTETEQRFYNFAPKRWWDSELWNARTIPDPSQNPKTPKPHLCL